MLFLGSNNIQAYFENLWLMDKLAVKFINDTVTKIYKFA
jgi:hypothetical protein